MGNSAAFPIASLSNEGAPFTLIGRRVGVDVFRRDHAPAVELAAVGEIMGARERVHTALLAHTDARIIATMAESWIKSAPPDATVLRGGLVLPNANQRDFSLSARWTAGSPIGMSFEIADDRGANTRERNWVDHITGSWGFDPVDEGQSTRAIYHVQIVFGSPVARWTIHNGAIDDLPTLIQHLRLLVA